MKDYLRSAKRSIARTVRESVTSSDPALEQKLKANLKKQGFSPFVGQVETLAHNILKRAGFDTEEAANEWVLSVKDLDKGTIARREDVQAVLTGLSRLRDVRDWSRGNEKAEVAALIMGLAVAGILSAEAYPHLLHMATSTKGWSKGGKEKGKHHLRDRNKDIQAEAEDIWKKNSDLSCYAVAELIRKRSLKSLVKDMTGGDTRNKKTLSATRIRKIIKKPL